MLRGWHLHPKKWVSKATIVMPRTTPRIKVDAVRARGAEVVLMGDSYDEAAAHATALVEKDGLTYIHPFDDPDVIAGQGTIGMEIVRQIPDPLDAIFIAVGRGRTLCWDRSLCKTVATGDKNYSGRVR